MCVQKLYDFSKVSSAVFCFKFVEAGILPNIMESIWKNFFSSVTKFLPVVKAEEEEDELVDPQVVLREECTKSHCQAYQDKLNTCNARVLSKKKTAETCAEELIDYMHCIDHCAAKTLFSKLK